MDETDSARASILHSSSAVPENRGARSSPSRSGRPPMRVRSRSDISPRRAYRQGDAIFRILVRGSGALLLVIMAAVALFLVLRAIPALQADTTSFFLTLKWAPDDTP